MDYVGNLLENCCGAYASIAQSFRSKPQPIVKFLGNFVFLLSKVIESLPKASESVNLAAFGLVGDLFETFGVSMLPFLDSSVYNTLLQRCQSSKSGKSISLVRFVMRNIAHVKRQAEQA